MFVNPFKYVLQFIELMPPFYKRMCSVDVSENAF